MIDYISVLAPATMTDDEVKQQLEDLVAGKPVDIKLLPEDEQRLSK